MKRHHWIAIGLFVLLGLALLLALLIFTAPAAQAPSSPADSSNLDDATYRVAKTLYCPVCPGVPLDVCDTQACQQWRALIREKLSQGQTPEEIEAYFVEQYGERVLGAPRPEGLNLVVYALPVLAIVGGAVLIYLTSRRWANWRHERGDASAASAVPDEYRARIERELRDTE